MRLTNTAQRKGRNPMFSRISKRLTYANVAATLALVFAMSGGAYAASKYLITSTKQIKPSVLASLKGKNGAAGPAGAQGAAGPLGPAGVGGAQGAKGENGANGKEGIQGKEGTAGKEGKAGESVANTALVAKNVNCAEGGSEFTVGGKHTYACNGSPWTAGGTLPSGATETGTWTFFAHNLITPEVLEEAAISFPIRLPGTGNAFLLNESETLGKTGTGGCTGTFTNPTAPEGTLCVYTENERSQNISVLKVLGFGPGYEPTGAFLVFEIGEKVGPTEPGSVEDEGTWAVTAP
jgi:hypothetical protein